MRRDLKKDATYRFNGNPHLDTGSIRPLSVADLLSGIRTLKAKLADPEDPDDPKWTSIWLNRYQAELEKKLQGRALKAEERAKAASRVRRRPRHEP